MDRTDFETMTKRIGYVNEITSKYIKLDKSSNRWKLRYGRLRSFSPEDKQKTMPNLKYGTIREYACGQ